MSITCKAAVIRDNKLTEPYKESKPLSIEEIKIAGVTFPRYRMWKIIV